MGAGSLRPPLNLYAHLRAAGSGDADALRALAREAGMLGAEGDEAAMWEALILSRLVYAASGESGDAGLLVAQLAFAADMAAAAGDTKNQTCWEGEAIAILSRLADEGVSLADDMLPGLVDAATPETTARAKVVRALMEQGG